MDSSIYFFVIFITYLYAFVSLLILRPYDSQFVCVFFCSLPRLCAHVCTTMLSHSHHYILVRRAKPSRVRLLSSCDTLNSHYVRVCAVGRTCQVSVCACVRVWDKRSESYLRNLLCTRNCLPLFTYLCIIPSVPSTPQPGRRFRFVSLFYVYSPSLSVKCTYIHTYVHKLIYPPSTVNICLEPQKVAGTNINTQDLKITLQSLSYVRVAWQAVLWSLEVTCVLHSLAGAEE